MLFAVARAGAEPRTWETGPGYRSTALTVPAEGRAGFQRVPGSESGILFTNVLATESGVRTQLRLAGSGVAAGDVDGDGWCDLYFCGMESGNRLYRNLGNWRFADITDQAGVRCPGQYSTGAALADADGDGDLDLFVNSIGGGTRLFLNDGRGHFQEGPDRGLLRKYGATTLTFGDVDGNGTLDLYVVNNNSPTSLGDEPNTRFTIQVVQGRPVIVAVDGKPLAGTELAGRYVVSPFDQAIREYGEPDILYLNDGKGHFSPTSWTNGVFLDQDSKPLTAAPRDLGLSAMFHDMNEDGAPDLYVCNDLFTPDRIYLNDGHGRFREMPLVALRSSSAFSMGVDFADIDRDGHDDFLVTDMLSPHHRERMIQAAHMTPVTIRAGEKFERTQLKRNVLQRNRGDGTYAEIALLSGVEASAWSWATLFLDVDLDGYEDILVAAGYDRDSMNGDVSAEISRRRASGNLSNQAVRDLGLLYPRIPSPIIAFRNVGDLRFWDAGREWGFDWAGVNQGICCADLDQDGDLEVIVNCLHDQPSLYRNLSGNARVAVRLKGAGANTRGIGAQIRLYGGAVPVQSQEMICGGRYLSSDDPVRVFAAGHSTSMRIEVRWRSGKRSFVEGVRPNREYEIDEAGAVQPPETKPTEPRPLFEDVSSLIKHRHHEEPFDDFARQPTLPRKLSQLGPGVTWFDLDGDGRDDLVIGSGRGGQLDLFMNPARGSFQRLPMEGLLGRAPDDETTILGWADSADVRGFTIGTANYESRGTNGIRRFELWAGGVQAKEVLETGLSSVGPLAMGDVDADGNLELFVGGRMNSGRWPEAPNSRLFRRVEGKFVLDAANSHVLENLGLVSGAVWSDLDGDGFPELVLACEWGPLRILSVRDGRLVDDTQRWGLDRYSGWWNGVTAGDFDNDGQMDLVASNWGRNTMYETARRHGQPLVIYYGNWNPGGQIDMMEAYHDPELGKIVPFRGLNTVVRALPWVRENCPTHAAYSEAAVEDLLGPRPARRWEATWLESTVFLNRKDHFEAVVLPGEAQFAPAFGVNVGDMDGDGHEDIFLSQNFFGVDEAAGRYDAGRGVWLKGNGRGQFTLVPGSVSGVMVYGEGRGSALCDFDGDGRIDLAVAQNSAETKLFHNVGATPGLRVRLEGPKGNPTGLGAVIRLRYDDGWGPAREVHAGSGYWSQDSPVQVLGMRKPPTSAWVRWPGGKTRVTPVAPGTASLTIKFDDPIGHE